MKMSEFQRGEIYRVHQGDERLRRDQQLLHGQLLAQNRELREAHEKSLNEMEELKRFQGSTFDTISRRKLVEDRDIIIEFTGKIQELHNEMNCTNDSSDFQDAESVRSGQSHVASQPVSHFIPILVECWGVLWECRAAKMGLHVFGTHGISGNVFCKSNGVFISTLSAGVESMEFSHIRTYITTCDEWEPNTSSESEMPVRTVSQKFSNPWWGNIFWNNYGADQQRLQISYPHFDKFPAPATFVCWKIRFKTEVCTWHNFPRMLCCGSKKWSWLIQWMIWNLRGL